jgi:methyltransferase (TIGR00027 family)
VILGAGLDSFAWRRPAGTESVRIFEVDLPAVLMDKQVRARRAGLPKPSHTHCVPLDLATPDLLPTTLARAGFDADRPAFFAWLGVAYYLSPEACCALIAAVGRCAAPGSHLVLDVLDAGAFAQPQLPELLAKTRRMARLFGELLPGGLLREQLAAPLAGAGFAVAQSLGPGQLTARYLAGRGDLHEVLPHLQVVHAIKQPLGGI